MACFVIGEMLCIVEMHIGVDKEILQNTYIHIKIYTYVCMYVHT